MPLFHPESSILVRMAHKAVDHIVKLDARLHVLNVLWARRASLQVIAHVYASCAALFLPYIMLNGHILLDA